MVMLLTGDLKGCDVAPTVVVVGGCWAGARYTPSLPATWPCRCRHGGACFMPTGANQE
jgi:hypothetical protein